MGRSPLRLVRFTQGLKDSPGSHRGRVAGHGGSRPLTLEDAAQLARALPEVTEGVRHGNRTWFTAGKAFAWERPLSKADVRRIGGQPPPKGPLLAVRVANLEEKEVLLLDPPPGFFDIEHFRGYPAVLLELEVVSRRNLKAAIAEAWRVCAPARFSLPAPGRPPAR